MKIIFRLLSILIIFNKILIASEASDIKILSNTFQSYNSPISEKVWPGFRLNEMPTVIHFKNGHAYAFHLSHFSHLWKQEFIEGYPVAFSKNQEALTKIPLHPHYNIEGTPCFIYSMNHGGGADFSLFTFVHERFHIHQFRFFENLNEANQSYYADHHQLDNLAMMELELRLLTQYLLSSEVEKELYLKQFCAVNETRRSRLKVPSVRWEDHQQRMEGMADYVSLKTFQVFDHLENFNVEAKLLEMRARKKSSSLYQDITRGRHYFVGAVIGFALDFCHIHEWKKSVSQGTKSLAQLLMEAYPMTTYEKQIYLAKAIDEFDYRSIKETLREKILEEKKALGDLKETFAEQEGVVVSVSRPHQHSTSGGRYKKSYHFEKTKVFIEEISTAMSLDQQWKLSFDSVPLIFEDNQGNRTFKMEAESQFILNERVMALSDIKRPIHFSSLSFKSQHSELKTTQPGVIYPANNGLKIQSSPFGG